MSRTNASNLRPLSDSSIYIFVVGLGDKCFDQLQTRFSQVPRLGQHVRPVSVRRLAVWIDFDRLGVRFAGFFDLLNLKVDVGHEESSLVEFRVGRQCALIACYRRREITSRECGLSLFHRLVRLFVVREPGLANLSVRGNPLEQNLHQITFVAKLLCLKHKISGAKVGFRASSRVWLRHCGGDQRGSQLLDYSRVRGIGLVKAFQ